MNICDRQSKSPLILMLVPVLFLFQRRILAILTLVKTVERVHYCQLYHTDAFVQRTIEEEIVKIVRWRAYLKENNLNFWNFIRLIYTNNTPRVLFIDFKIIKKEKPVRNFYTLTHKRLSAREKGGKYGPCSGCTPVIKLCTWKVLLLWTGCS